MSDVNNKTPEPTKATEQIVETLKEVSTGPEPMDVEEPEAGQATEDSGVINDSSQPFPTGGEVVSTIEGVDSDADDFVEHEATDQERVEVSTDSDLYVAPEEELNPDEDDDEK